MNIFRFETSRNLRWSQPLAPPARTFCVFLPGSVSWMGNFAVAKPDYFQEAFENLSTMIEGRLEATKTLREIEVMNNARGECVTGSTDKDLDEISETFQSISMFKPEDNSEAFLMTKRSKAGLEAWYHVHRWYMTISGEGSQTGRATS